MAHCSRFYSRHRVTPLRQWAFAGQRLEDTWALPPSCPLSQVSRLLTFGLLDLIAPTEDASLGPVMLSPDLIAALHPNTGHRGVDVDVLRAKGEGLFAGCEGLVQLTRGEVHLGLGQPSFEAGWIGGHRRLQLRQRRRLVAHGEIERRLVRQGQGAR